MSKELKFYICEHCKNVIVKVSDSQVPVVCCGSPMKELVANTTDASQEKHVPVVTRENNIIKVSVGSEIHPMTEAHYIEFIVLETASGFRVAYLKPTDEPTVEFYSDEPVIAVYAYCNLHGLWKTSI
ncbi:MAG: desulfoferrodoxin Dfx [Erysipelotrichaceae bacterium]|nr:desulfoferrodoxin Dfx [Erysipelotrichaceae bacterium]MDY5252280.1 desulfoferrodoxin family protein [Erysipelotrichaceae bacterium]